MLYVQKGSSTANDKRSSVNLSHQLRVREHSIPKMTGLSFPHEWYRVSEWQLCALGAEVARDRTLGKSGICLLPPTVPPLSVSPQWREPSQGHLACNYIGHDVRSRSHSQTRKQLKSASQIAWLAKMHERRLSAAFLGRRPSSSTPRVVLGYKDCYRRTKEEESTNAST